MVEKGLGGGPITTAVIAPESRVLSTCMARECAIDKSVYNLPFVDR